MRAIIIDNKDVMALLEQMELEKYCNQRGASKYRADQPADVEEVHRWFHYIVVRWLQEQGASCVRGGL